jgi:hypothetical protein
VRAWTTNERCLLLQIKQLPAKTVSRAGACMLTAVCVLIEAQILRHSQPLTRPRAQPCTCAYAVYLCLRSVPVPTQCTCAYAVYLCLRSVPVPTQQLHI